MSAEIRDIQIKSWRQALPQSVNYNVTILLLSLLSGTPGLTQLSNLMLSMLIQVIDYHAARMRKSGGGVGLLLIFQVIGFNHTIIIPPNATRAWMKG